MFRSSSATLRGAHSPRSRPDRRRPLRWAPQSGQPRPTPGDRSSRSPPSATTSRSESSTSRIAAIHDVGRIINPLGARSQVEGGIIQGLGHTLSEERLLDPKTGATLTQTLDSYKLPTIADVPEIVCEFVDKPDEHLTNLGSKGLGEPPIIPTAAAISNAIRDATGADVRSLPITRDELLRALEAAREKERREAPAPA